MPFLLSPILFSPYFSFAMPVLTHIFICFLSRVCSSEKLEFEELLKRIGKEKIIGQFSGSQSFPSC